MAMKKCGADSWYDDGKPDAESVKLSDLLVLRLWIQKKCDDEWYSKMYNAEADERYSEAFMWQQMIESAQIITEKIDEILKQN